VAVHLLLLAPRNVKFLEGEGKLHKKKESATTEGVFEMKKKGVLLDVSINGNDNPISHKIGKKRETKKKRKCKQDFSEFHSPSNEQTAIESCDVR